MEGAGSINNNKNLQLTSWIGLLKTPARQIEMRVGKDRLTKHP